MVGRGTRKIALCVSTWAAESTLYSWNYTKQHFLRAHPPDELYIVHVAPSKGLGSAKRSQGWSQGGSLMHSLQESLKNYPHTVVELSGNNVTGATLEWAEATGIDVLIMGSRDATVVRTAMTKLTGDWGLGSVSSRTLQHTRIPLLIVRPDAALKLNKLRINPPPPEQAAAEETATSPRLGRGSMPPALVRTLSPGRLAKYEPGEGRLVGLAYEDIANGRTLLAWAASTLLQPSDQVFILHVVSKPSPVTVTADALSIPHKARGDGGGNPLLSDAAVREALAGGLEGVDIVSNTQLRGDPRDRICSFAEDEGLDLLVVGRSLGSRFKKAFTPGGTVSQYCVAHACCPVLVYPHKASPSGVVSPAELSPREQQPVAATTRAHSADEQPQPSLRQASAPALSVPPVFDVVDLKRQLKDRDAEIMTLKAALAAKDAEVAALKEEVQKLQAIAPPPDVLAGSEPESAAAAAPATEAVEAKPIPAQPTETLNPKPPQTLTAHPKFETQPLAAALPAPPPVGLNPDA